MSESSHRPAVSVGVPTLLIFAFGLFAVGIAFPFFHVTKFWVFADGVSVLGGIWALAEAGEYFLFGILTLFTLIFPVAKLSLLALIWTERDQDLAKVRKLHHWVAVAGKWSMLDVFVVAILIVIAKGNALAEITIGPGIYCFTLSVISTQLASLWIDRILPGGRA